MIEGFGLHSFPLKLKDTLGTIWKVRLTFIACKASALIQITDIVGAVSRDLSRTDALQPSRHACAWIVNLVRFSLGSSGVFIPVADEKLSKSICCTVTALFTFPALRDGVHHVELCQGIKLTILNAPTVIDLYCPRPSLTISGVKGSNPTNCIGTKRFGKLGVGVLPFESGEIPPVPHCYLLKRSLWYTRCFAQIHRSW